MTGDAWYAGDGDATWLPELAPDGRVTDALCVFCEGRLVYITELSARWMGAQCAEEIIGRSLTDIVPADQLSALAGVDQYLQKPGDSTPRLFSTLLLLDGTRVDNDIVLTLIEWDGKPAFQVEIYDISQRSAVEKSVEYESAMITHASDALIATTFSGLITSWNPAAAAMYGVTAEQAIGRPISEVADSRLNLRSIVLKGGVEYIEIGTGQSGESVVWIRVSVSVMHIGYVVVCVDNTALRRAERRFQAILDTLDGGVVVISPDGTIESMNPAAVELYGRNAQGQNWDDVAAATLPSTHNTAGQVVRTDPVAETRRTGTPFNGLIFGYDRGPSDQIWISMGCRRLDPSNPADTSVLVTVSDFTGHQLVRERLAHDATHDHLTGLYNRSHMLRLIESALEADDNLVRVVLFIDLDNLKSTNDSLGHDAGDYLLKMSAQRLVDGVGPDNVVARHGGDEFVCLLHLSESDDIEVFCSHIHEALSRPIEFNDIALLTGASIGVRVLRDEDADAAVVLADADLAMYQAKSAGRNQVRMSNRV